VSLGGFDTNRRGITPLDLSFWVSEAVAPFLFIEDLLHEVGDLLKVG
jgi:hypothetical protein